MVRAAARLPHDWSRLKRLLLRRGFAAVPRSDALVVVATHGLLWTAVQKCPRAAHTGGREAENGGNALRR